MLPLSPSIHLGITCLQDGREWSADFWFTSPSFQLVSLPVVRGLRYVIKKIFFSQKRKSTDGFNHQTCLFRIYQCASLFQGWQKAFRWQEKVVPVPGVIRSVPTWLLHGTRSWNEGLVRKAFPCPCCESQQAGVKRKRPAIMLSPPDL